MRRNLLIDMVICVIAVMVMLLTLLPSIARVQRTNAEATCQANMHRWGQALALYTIDNDGRYPTNRNNAGVLSPMIPLGSKIPSTDGGPIRFYYGYNWVEALYPYIAQIQKRAGYPYEGSGGSRGSATWRQFAKCPNSSDATFPPSGDGIPSMTYVMNYNLIEYPTVLIRDISKVMLLRETDRLVNAVCRPSNISSSSNVMPQYPFLVGTNDGYGTTSPALNPNLHTNGSYIAFADGHVAWFDASYFPLTANGAQRPQWDVESNKWWNSVTYGPENIRKAIAITP